MRKWNKNSDGLFVTNCDVCGNERLTKKRPYHGNTCASCHGKRTIKIAKKYNYTESRNSKISKARKEYWDSYTKEERSSMIKDRMKDYIGSEKHIEICKSNQVKATKAAMNLKGMSAPEIEFAEFLDDLGISYETQYFVEQYPFDFYLTETSQLVEIDGEFYHPLKESDCKYPIQKHNFFRDIHKNKVAERNGFNLTRLRIPKS